MSSNVLKSGYITYKTGEKRIIDVMDSFSRHFETEPATEPEDYEEPAEMSEEEAFAAGLTADMDAQVESALFDDESESGNVYKPIRHAQPSSSQHSHSLAEIEQMKQQAMEEIEQMQRQAMEEIETLRQKTLEQAMEEGKKEGFSQGKAEGMNSLEAEKAALRQEVEAVKREYYDQVEDLEVHLVDVIGSVYEHVFGIRIAEDREVLLHLIDTTIHDIDSGKEFLIHVSPEDYPFVNMQRRVLADSMLGSTIEVTEDRTMKKGSCLIETGGGIFDCSVDVELRAIGQRLRLLSYEKD